jgi:predicted RNA-binding protein YlqC (UPF0109 family)
MTTQEQGRETMVSLVRGIVLALVDVPESVKVEGALENGCVVLDVLVGPTDAGKVIGKQGRTARSLRTILGAVSMKLKIRCELNIQNSGEVMRGEGKDAA